MTPFAGPICVVPPNAIETVSGRYVDAVSPDPESIYLHDIAWALSRQARFAGHTLSDEVWNVAQHSLFVEDLVDAAINDPEDNYQVQTSLQLWLNDKGMREAYRNREFHPLTTQMGALMHDGSEAYLIDLPSPVKRHDALREPYKVLERGINEAILKGLDLPEMTALEHEIMVWADLLALQIEAANLMPSRGRGWNGSLPSFEAQHLHLFPRQVQPWRLSYQDFIHRFMQLRQDL